MSIVIDPDQVIYIYPMNNEEEIDFFYQIFKEGIKDKDQIYVKVLEIPNFIIPIQEIRNDTDKKEVVVDEIDNVWKVQIQNGDVEIDIKDKVHEIIGKINSHIICEVENLI